jgi:hypothetical protein
MTEFALVLAPILIVIIFGLVELAFLMNDAMTLSTASREGARVGGALVNGGGALGCGSGQSPNAANVDPIIVASVERILTGTGAPITLQNVTQIRIWKATATGDEVVGFANVWTYQANSGPVVDGDALDFVQQSQPWLPCTRSNVTPPDSIGVTVRYTYRPHTPVGFLVPYLSSLPMSERSVMAENVSR